MAWGCKQKPNGCGWAAWVEYRRLGVREWWCDLCERDGELAIRQDRTSPPGPVPPLEPADG